MGKGLREMQEVSRGSHEISLRACWHFQEWQEFHPRVCAAFGQCQTQPSAKCALRDPFYNGTAYLG